MLEIAIEGWFSQEKIVTQQTVPALEVRLTVVKA
jgi:hypothetical protein